MKKGNEKHLTLIIESRVLKLQKMARSFYQIRMRASKTLKDKLINIFKFKRFSTIYNSPMKNKINKIVGTPTKQLRSSVVYPRDDCFLRIASASSRKEDGNET